MQNKNCIGIKKNNYLLLMTTLLLLVPVIFNILGFNLNSFNLSAYYWLIVSCINFSVIFSLLILIIILFIKKTNNRKYLVSLFLLLLGCLFIEIAWITVDVLSITKVFNYKQLRNTFFALNFINYFTTTIYLGAFISTIPNLFSNSETTK